LTLRLQPTLSPDPGILVSVTAPWARRFVLSSSELRSVTDAKARDGLEGIAVTPRAEGDRVLFELAPSHGNNVVLTYRVNAAPFAVGADPSNVSMDETRLVASGERLLALPEQWGDRPVSVSMSFDSSAFGPESRAASSFGVGRHVRFEASAAALRRATFIAGPMGHAVLDGPEGRDEGAWLGYTAFDPRAAIAEVAGFRSAARELFGERAQLPFTFLLVADSRPAGEFDVARRTTSVLVRVGLSQSYNGPLRVSVAQQVLREWIGATLYVGDPAKPGEARWFTQGFSRYVARELQFRFGLMTPAEYLAEVEALERIVATSPGEKSTNADLAARTDGGAVALQTARGARHAADLDARLRAKSKGKRSLDHMLRELYARAVGNGGALPDAEWRALLERELDVSAVLRFEESVHKGVVAPLPRDALGPCFTPVARRYGKYGLGLAFDSDPERMPVTIRSVDPAGPAARAGLRPGDRVTRLRHRDGDASYPATFDIERAGERRRIELSPVIGTVPGHGFQRVKGLSDEACPRR